MKKIAIIGGGICGLYLASKLSDTNKVEVFERKKEIGKKYDVPQSTVSYIKNESRWSNITPQKP